MLGEIRGSLQRIPFEHVLSIYKTHAKGQSHLKPRSRGRRGKMWSWIVWGRIVVVGRRHRQVVIRVAGFSGNGS